MVADLVSRGALVMAGGGGNRGGLLVGAMELVMNACAGTTRQISVGKPVSRNAFTFDWTEMGPGMLRVLEGLL